MTNRSVTKLIVAGLVGVFYTSASAVAQHAGDLWIGHDDTGQLQIGGFDYQTQPVILPETSGLLNGWADNAPGFDRLIGIDSAHGWLPMESGANVWVEIVALDPALRMITNSFNILDTVGDQTRLGDHLLHIHNTWHIDADDPAFDDQQACWNMTLIAFDTGATDYSDSPPFTLTFCNTPCQPGDINYDGVVDFFDIDPFVSALVDGPHDAAAACASDINDDGAVDFFDIDPFVDLVVNSG
jgi:hypothetical protein